MKLLSVLLLPNLAMRDGVGILARSLRDGVCILARRLRDGADILARRLRDGAEIPEWCINSNPQSAGKYTYRCNSVQITLIRMVPPPVWMITVWSWALAAGCKISALRSCRGS